ncbi:MAG: thymidylate kinase [Planctomycetaceae bacterium]|nr:thymidylate kinase [Planctomycetaceae bacterium]
MAFLIDIEGIDGTGKGTQAQRLVERLTRSGLRATLISFPRYEATIFGRAIGEFLNGKFGSLADVPPFLVSLLFAGDRFESKPVLLAALRENDVVVLDRYVASNVAHQASKCDGGERVDLAQKILKIEHEIFDLPRPDLVLLLDLPVPWAQRLISLKAARSYTDRAADLQEADAVYLGRVRDVYLSLAQTDSHWRLIPCSTAAGVRSIDAIGDEIWSVVASARTAAGAG